MLVWCVLSFGRTWTVCEVVLVPYVNAMGAVNVMRVLLFVLHVCMLKEYKAARLMAMQVWGRGMCGCGECMA